jgi:hypothetical protein
MNSRVRAEGKESSFLQKRTKKLLSVVLGTAPPSERPEQIKVFLLLFLQKMKGFSFLPLNLCT